MNMAALSLPAPRSTFLLPARSWDGQNRIRAIGGEPRRWLCDALSPAAELEPTKLPALDSRAKCTAPYCSMIATKLFDRR